jgi:dimethylhistidine N-methyltransferase
LENQIGSGIELSGEIMGLANIKTRSIPIDTLAISDSEADEVVQALQKTPKILPPKFFYDQRGSQLFDQICELEVYYLTRTETAIMQQNIGDIARLVGPKNLLVEFGSGSSHKTRFLLDRLPALEAYIPVDISQRYLFKTADSLSQDYPNLSIFPLWADFTKPFSLPPLGMAFERRLAYFPGSTFGNFYPRQARTFLRNVAELVGPGGGFLVGLDLQKDPHILNLAYNDPQGVTAAFNRNMLKNINQKFGADFEENCFDHFALYNPIAKRVEMYLISQTEQVVQLNGTQIRFRRGEYLLTEVSYKYTLADFAQLAQQAGFKVQNVWLDGQDFFSVQYLIAS